MDGHGTVAAWTARLVSIALIGSLAAPAWGQNQNQAPNPAGNQNPAGNPNANANQSQTQSLGFNVGYGVTDNLGLDAGQGVRSAFDVLGLDFGLGHQSPRLTGGLNGDVALYHYAKQGVLSHDQQVVGSLDGQLGLEVVPQRFGWDFGESYGQARTNPLAPIGPRNRERVTVISTGPRATIPLGGRTSLQLGGRLAERRFQTTSLLDARVTSAQLGIVRTISRVSQSGLQFSKSRTELESTGQIYDVENVFINYTRGFVAGGVEGRLGTGKVTLANQSSSIATMNFAWNRQLGTRTRFNLAVGRQYTDAGELFRLGGIPGIGGTPVGRLATLGGFRDVTDITDSRSQDVILTSNPVERSSLGLGFDIGGRRTDISVGFGASKDNFVGGSTLDNDARHMKVGVSRTFNTRWSGDVQLSRWRRHFLNDPQPQVDTRDRLTFNRSVGRRGALLFALQHNARDSGTSPYRENLYSVAFRYELGR
jgi:hypothetical protein